MKEIKNFILRHESKIVIFAGFIAVAFLAFQIGFREGIKVKEKPIVIEKVLENTSVSEKNFPSVETGASVLDKVELSENSGNIKDCAFVGSKNSNKVHVSNCPFAKRIKPENLVCFKSLEDALNQGRQKDKSCIK